MCITSLTPIDIYWSARDLVSGHKLKAHLQWYFTIVKNNILLFYKWLHDLKIE